MGKVEPLCFVRVQITPAQHAVARQQLLRRLLTRNEIVVLFS